MKKLRFIIAIVLIFSLLPIFSVSAEDQINSTQELLTCEFKKLEAFGLVSESDHLFYYGNVKRSIFMSYIMKCFPGYSENAATGIKNPFSDVTAETYGANAILRAAEIGLINGADGTAFRPDESITKSEAAKVFVSMLGYSEYAERKGGYPSGYLAMAQSLGIFDGCEFN